MAIMTILLLTALVPTAVLATALGLERLEGHLLRPAPDTRRQAGSDHGMRTAREATAE